MKNRLNELTHEISTSLENASLGYYYLGIELYSKIDEHDLDNFQVALGNISISCELILKTFIAKKMFGCLYPNLKKEYQAVLYYPESVSENQILNKVVRELKSFSVKTIGISEATSLFYQIYPDKQKEYKQYLKFISEVRNLAVHVSLLDYQIYLLEKVVYITTKLFVFADQEGIISNTDLNTSDYYKNIIESYNYKKTDSVNKKINEAKKVMSQMGNSHEFEAFEYEIQSSIKETCPVCDNDGISYGYLENIADYGYNIDLFNKTSFKCNNCNLSLEDEQELRLANIATYVTP